MSTARGPGARGRTFQAFAGRPVVARGLPARPLADVFHFLITSPWRRLFALIVAAYLAANALFAAGYLALGDDIENATPGSFSDAFFFSVQTMATIGYGKMSPKTLGAHLLVSVETVVGMLGLATMTGLVFTKFARPTARVLFSAVAVVRPYEGVPSLMIRMANARASQIVEATLSMVLVRGEVTSEGEQVRRIRDLKLVRGRSAMFALTWTAIHPIDEDSPLYGQDAAAYRASDADLIVSLTGLDESLAQTVHARHAYRADEVRFGHRFVDVLAVRPDGVREIDYGRFDETEPMPAPRAAASSAAGLGGAASARRG